MDWGQILVDSGIVAIISAGAVVISTLLANVFTDIKGYRKINRKIGDEPNITLIGQHKMIEGAVIDSKEQLSREIGASSSSLLSKIESSAHNLLSKVEKINDRIVEKDADQRNNYRNLDKDQQKIKDNVEAIYGLMKDWERVNTRNKELENRVRELESQYAQLLSRYNQLSARNSERDMER